MIRSMFNLRCAAGHRHYSPTPSLWARRECGKPLGDVVLLSDGTVSRTTKKCKEPMKSVGDLK